MSEQDRQEARERLGRAGRQSKHAAKNTARAAQLGAEVVADEAADALSHAASAVEDVAEDVVDTAKRELPSLSARGLAAISSDTGVGFLATAVSLYSGALAFHKFRSAIQGRGRAIN